MGSLLKSFQSLDVAMSQPRSEPEKLRRDYQALVTQMKVMGIAHTDLYRGIIGSNGHDELVSDAPYDSLSDVAKRLLPMAVLRARKKVEFLRNGGDVKDFRLKSRKTKADREQLSLDEALRAVYQALHGEVVKVITSRIKTGRDDDGQEPLLNLFRAMLAYKPELDEEGQNNA